MSDHIHQAELTALEAALKGLAPAPAALDRDQLFFRAGQASSQRGRWLPRFTIASLALAVAVLGTLLAWQPREQRVAYKAVITLPAPAPPPVDVPAPPSTEPLPEVGPSPSVVPAIPAQYLRLREQALRWGVESLPDVDLPPLADVPQRPLSMLDLLPSKS